MKQTNLSIYLLPLPKSTQLQPPFEDWYSLDLSLSISLSLDLSVSSVCLPACLSVCPVSRLERRVCLEGVGFDGGLVGNSCPLETTDVVEKDWIELLILTSPNSL